MKKRIVLIGAADSIGVPYSKDNYDNKGFFEMIEQYLSSNYEVVTINCFHMSTNNDNKYIIKIINNNILTAAANCSTVLLLLLRAF